MTDIDRRLTRLENRRARTAPGPGLPGAPWTVTDTAAWEREAVAQQRELKAEHARRVAELLARR